MDAERPTPAERAARGKDARAEARRSSHAELDLSGDRDPIGLLEAEGRTRVPELVPIRYGRMLASPLAFFRGAATVMAHDLASTPTAGLRVQLSGDAHLENFGGFASPERDLVFDLNDFDETLPGPFEWDVKRLATSFELAGRERSFSTGDRQQAVLAGVRSYREAMRGFAGMGDLDVWYARLNAQAVHERLRSERDPKLDHALRRSETKAYAHDAVAALARLTHEVEGRPRFVSDPPLIVPLSELAGGRDEGELESLLRELFRTYRRTLPTDRRALLERYRYGDLARKVVGVGSVGRRCWVLLLFGRDEDDPLVLQIKEARPSVLEPLLGPSGFATYGQRVVLGQLLMQAASDIFLGWVHSEEEVEGGGHDFYLRQLWDWKTSLRLESLLPRGLAAYAQACGWALARAHARTGDRIAIASYLGGGDTFDRAIAEFAGAYADVNERDHAALGQALSAGRLTAIVGV
jgi:uncharacterized protein (DUF2252 family)